MVPPERELHLDQVVMGLRDCKDFLSMRFLQDLAVLSIFSFELLWTAQKVEPLLHLLVTVGAQLVKEVCRVTSSSKPTRNPVQAIGDLRST